ncbi:FecCD family ABC transporter permease [Corynebacterium terpenotabidum]|uniref:Zinc ABC transport system permease n=1 Tax=Corynebacterium terpenotabidum Y-11 TaxID=1200352 RepID=S4XH17_9CORY|nr:iron ABC transporter permease [Corynebacterium terpenotabidum]AGP31841.1 zinc ABC transport system permease [Corynebacterium terpenotabidum Y-11]
MTSTADVLGLRAARRRALAWVTALTLALLVTLMISVGFGAVSVSPTDSLRIISHHLVGTALDASDGDLFRHDAVIWTIRTPRAVLGAFVGAGLAVAGVILQATVRNILADPYVLGVNSGASVGAAAAILTGIGAGFGDYALQTSAFLGATVASFGVFGVSRAGGRITPTRLIMAGVAVGYALSALTSFMVFASDSAESARSVMFWLLGSLGLASWSGPLTATVIVVLAVTAVLLVIGPRLDALTVGDETALTLGIDPDRMRIAMLVVSCLLVGTLVAMAGSIGFVGLVVPHLARRLVGGAHRAVIPVSALLGAVLLLWADIGSRTLLAPQEIPIGIITAIVGAPFLLLLVHRMHATPTD